MTDRKQMQEAARLLGRRGGLKGGKARAEKLSGARRRAIARMGAAVVNAALEGLEPEARRRLIMRRRTYTAYLAGHRSWVQVIDGVLYTGPVINPFPDTAFQAPLHRAWEIGLDHARLGMKPKPFHRWRGAPARPRSRKETP